MLVMNSYTDIQRQILEGFFYSAPTKPLIVILGPTASGKTSFSMSLAHELRDVFGKTAEIVNADSRQFYRGFDIGTAKITPAEKQGIAHHLINVLGPQEDCTIAWYKREAERVIADIHAYGNIPVIVGGSMLYIAAIVDGLEPLPLASPGIRERLEREYDADSGKTLFARLTEIDPETAASFPMQNKVYVVRALEIFESTGKTKSAQKKKSPGVFDLLMFGMDIDKDDLSKKIAARTKLMFENGWIDEVRKLREQGIRLTDPAMKSVGYREILKFVETCESHVSTTDDHVASTNDNFKTLSETIQSQTRAYAKRHMTWWKRDSRVCWIRP